MRTRRLSGLLAFALFLPSGRGQTLAAFSASQEKGSSMLSISQIDYESSASSILCHRHRIVLNQDGTSALFTELCRNRRPGDRATFCQVKRGTVLKSEFERLSALLDRGGFFKFKGEYDLDPDGFFTTDSGFESMRVIRSAKIYKVVSYNGNGPSALWVMFRAIEGVSAQSEWSTIHEQMTCPAWQKGPIAP